MVRKITRAMHAIDHSVGRLARTRRVLVELRTPVYQAVLDGFGIARLAAFLVNDDLKSGRLIKLLGPYVDTRARDLYLIVDADKIALAKYAGFAEFIKTKFAGGF